LAVLWQKPNLVRLIQRNAFVACTIAEHLSHEMRCETTDLARSEIETIARCIRPSAALLRRRSWQGIDRPEDLAHNSLQMYRKIYSE
jgi:hypothetical protein